MGLRFFKRRNHFEATNTMTPNITASMGLRFFKRRNLGRFLCDLFCGKCRFNGAALFQAQKSEKVLCRECARKELQWGCAFSSAEIPVGKYPVLSCVLLQWGCAFSSAEIDAKRKDISVLASASMGLRFFKRRNTVSNKHKSKNRKQASMGLRFFKRRNDCDNNLAGPVRYLLQWGCAFSSAEMSVLFFDICFRDTRFNGAALFQAQK